jgi:hypothetical protein
MGLPLEVMTTSSSLILLQISLGLVFRSLTEMKRILNLLIFINQNLSYYQTIVNQNFLMEGSTEMDFLQKATRKSSI